MTQFLHIIHATINVSRAQQQTSNEELSKQIEALRKEQKIAEQHHQRLERGLAAKKDQMQEIIEEAEYAFSEREHAELQIAKLKTGAESERGTAAVRRCENMAWQSIVDRLTRHNSTHIRFSQVTYIDILIVTRSVIGLLYGGNRINV